MTEQFVMQQVFQASHVVMVSISRVGAGSKHRELGFVSRRLVQRQQLLYGQVWLGVDWVFDPAVQAHGQRTVGAKLKQEIKIELQADYRNVMKVQRMGESKISWLCSLYSNKRKRTQHELVYVIRVHILANARNGSGQRLRTLLRFDKV